MEDEGFEEMGCELEEVLVVNMFIYVLKRVETEERVGVKRVKSMVCYI
jgi:hypothetical protein